MRLPNPDRALVDEAKVERYLLPSEHPEGRLKAVVFHAAGYRSAWWRVLQADPAATAYLEADRVTETPFGQKYEVSAILRGPAGRGLAVTVVWLVRRDEVFPRLVTAFPRRRP